jgi:hypothetical protein
VWAALRIDLNRHPRGSVFSSHRSRVHELPLQAVAPQWRRMPRIDGSLIFLMPFPAGPAQIRSGSPAGCKQGVRNRQGVRSVQMFFHALRNASMFFQRYRFLVWPGKVSVIGVALIWLAAPTAQADTLSPGYSMQNVGDIAPEGQFTAYNGQIHYWTSAGGYQIYNTTTGSSTTIGLPPNGTNTNGFGDAFGVFDHANNVFYAGSVNNNSSSIYQYNGTAGTWSNSTSAGLVIPNAFGAQVYNGKLYVSGLASSSSPPTNILAFGQNAVHSGTQPQTLIQAPGYSAYLAVAPDGDVYYATSTYYTSGSETDNLYRWSAQQVASLSSTSTPLMLTDATEVATLPGNGSGLALDSAGNVFFAVNDNVTGVSTLGIVDPAASQGYDPIYTSDGDFFGAISADGNFLNGGTLYFNPGIDYANSVIGIQAVPEPSSLALLASAMAVVLIARRRRRE